MNKRLFSVAIFALLTASCLWSSGSRDAGATSFAKSKLRVMTYNIHVGVGMDKKLDLQRIADVINQEHPQTNRVSASTIFSIARIQACGSGRRGS
jgi:hypothetical protein